MYWQKFLAEAAMDALKHVYDLISQDPFLNKIVSAIFWTAVILSLTSYLRRLSAKFKQHASATN